MKALRLAMNLCFKFLAVSTAVILISFVTTYTILKSNIDKKLLDLERTAQLVANQVSTANLNSILAFTADNFIFIIHQREGRVLFESAQRPEQEKRIWEDQRVAVISEMMQNKEGQLRFPDKKSWQLLSLQKEVRYVFLSDLDWIIAVELPAAVTWHKLLSVYSLFVWSAILSFCFLATLILFPVKKQQSNRVVIEETPVKVQSESSEPFELPKSFQPEEKPQPQIALLETEDKLTAKLVEEAKKMLGESEKKKMPALEPAIAVEEKQSEIKKENPNAVIYFEKMMENKPKKSQPDTIIGMALSKKTNREKVDID